jgi:hypothetical protein
MEQAGSSAADFLQQLKDAGFCFQSIDEEGQRLISVDTVDDLIAEHRNLQYTGPDLRRSHANLLCIRTDFQMAAMS